MKKRFLINTICLFLLCLSIIPTSVYAITYYVKFNPNGGSGTMSNQTFTTDEEKYLSTNTFTREGYNFIGWNSNTGGTGTWYMPSKKVKNLTSTSGATVNVYAQWISKNQGSMTIGGTQVTKDSGGNYILDNYKRYTVTVNVTNGTPATSSKTVEYYTSAVFNLTPNNNYGNPTVSCTNSQSGSITNNTLTVTGLSNNTTCTVTYAPITFVLTANANNGSIPSTTGWTGTGSTATKSVMQGAQYGTLPTPTRTGYSFDGWFTQSTGGTQVSSTTTMGSAATTIHAHWTALSYTVTLNPIGGTIPTTSGWNISTTYSEKSETISDEAPETNICCVTSKPTLNASTGLYTVSGTYISYSSLSSANYYCNLSSTNASAGGSCSTTTNAVAYSPSGSGDFSTNYYVSSDMRATKSITYATTYGTLPTPTKVGNTFAGWYTAETGGTQRTSSTSMTTASSHTLYAHWTEKSYKVLFLKTKSNKTPLPGVAFQLTGVDYNNNEVSKTVTSDIRGRVLFEVPVGEYEIVETVALTNYHLEDSVLQVSVTDT